MQRDIVILDLFSGIGGFSLGFQRAGYNIKKHYFSEIDKHAIAVYKHNFKNSEYVGSVTDVRGGGIHRPNVITFGSPCQDFSLAGKRQGMEGERSSLILHAIRLIQECQPDVFIWENVKGAFSSNSGADFWAIIQAFANIGGYRLEWQLLNTAWFLPQNRERIYLVGHLGEGGGRNVFPLGEELTRAFEGAKQTANTFTAGGNSGGMHSNMTLVRHRSTQPYQPSDIVPTIRNGDKSEVRIVSATSNGYEVAEPGDSINLSQPNSETRRGRVGKGKAQTLETSCNQAVIPVLTPDRMSKRQNGRRFKEDGDPAFTLTSQDRHGVIIGDYRSDEGFRERKDGNCPTLPAQARSDHRNGSAILKTTNNIRRLTEIECERLQGFPDNWSKYGNFDGEVKEVSRTQRYKQLGNAVTVDVVAEIAQRL